MTREIRSRRAGLSRDEARQQPLYARLLGLQYVTPNGFLCFIFFEGAVALGILLALAELVSWWGVLVLPVTVAVMVKLNDVVAGAVIQTPSAASRTAASLRTPGLRAPDTRDSVSVNAAQTALTAGDQASAGYPLSGTRTTPAALPSVRRAAVRPATASPVAYPVASLAAESPATAGIPGTEADVTPVGVTTATVSRAAGSHTPQATSDVPHDASALNGPPLARHWDAPTERLDNPVRWARQAASRRYE